MGPSRPCLLLLLSSFTLAQGIEETPSCQLASRFKPEKKYMYEYIAESENSVTGSASLRNGHKVSCQVEIEAPQTCHFTMHTRGCTLSEEPQGGPGHRPAPSSDGFRTSMERNPLRFTVDSSTRVWLHPDKDEPVNILNIKRGIISAFMLPVMDHGQRSYVSTVHGVCLTEYTVKARQDIPTDVTLSRDLSQCERLSIPARTNSPLALLQHLHSPMSKLISSTQSCSYQIDHRGAHITAATCSETHTYLPLAQGENKISSVVTQKLNFQNVKRFNNRNVAAVHDLGRLLQFEDPEDKTPVQTEAAVLSTLKELVALSGTNQGERRTGLFHKLVSSMRALRNETLSPAVHEMVKVSGWLTFQALIQCGTSECTSAIMQIIWTIDGVSLEVDALVHVLGLQANPNAARVRDMLSMAQFKQSRAIMYALANTVNNFHQNEDSPEVTEVSEFLKMLLNDCSDQVRDDDSDFFPDPVEDAFLTLRVVGIMGRRMQRVSPSLVSSVLRCAKNASIPLSNQKAAIQALRLMEADDEIRGTLMDIYQDYQSPSEKRVASYLVLMENPDQTLIRHIVHGLRVEKDEQLKSFVVSHLKNHLKPEDQIPEIREILRRLLKDQQSHTNHIFDGLSRNYKVTSPLGSMQSNIIFDGKNSLPKDVTLDGTLKGFWVDHDIFKVSVEGDGFEPGVDAIFGKTGFLPETISRLVKLAGDSVPMLRGVLGSISAGQQRMRKQVPEDHLKAIRDSFQKLLNDMQLSSSPEATAYLQLLGKELGYMKTSDMRKMLETFFMYYHILIRGLPATAFFKLTSSTENEVFFHYIFMENILSLPTGSGFPLKFSLSGVFAPGAKGGLTPSTGDLTFMPSLGLEFFTEMGVHLPDYVDSGVEMHTSLYHESSFKAKASVTRNQIQLSVPAPASNIQLISISNKLLSVSSGQTEIAVSSAEDRVDQSDCQPLFKGLNLCTVMQYSNATSLPYDLLTSETKLAVEIQPTGSVTQYTATLTDERLREGKKDKGRSLQLTLMAEGEESKETIASVKCIRDKNSLSSEVSIPDYDVEAAVHLAVTDGEKVRGFTVDVSNKKVPQLTLNGAVRLEPMKEATLQLQMEIPSWKTDASITAVLRNGENTIVDLELVAHLLESSLMQKTSLKYDDDKFQVELDTDLNADLKKMFPNSEEHHKKLQKLIDDILDHQVAKTDMKLRHIVTKGIQAGNIWLDKLTLQFPSLAQLRSKRSISDLTLPPIPEKLFFQSESFFRYQFNKDRIAVSLTLPLGGKTSEEMNFPKTLSVPEIDLSLIGLYVPARKLALPSFTVPPSLDFTVPLLGLAELSTKMNSNFYSWEGSISGGNNTADTPSYVVQYKAMAQSPVRLLSYMLEGAGMISGRADNDPMYLLNTTFSHILFDASFSVMETVRVANKLTAQANYKLHASSPLGLLASFYYSAQSVSTLDSAEVSGDGTVDGLLKLGSLYTNTSYSHSYNLRPLDREGRGESTLHFDSPIIQFDNMIQGLYANSELDIVSKTSSQGDLLKHMAVLKYKDSQVTLKCNAVGSALGKSLSNKVELGLSSHMSVLTIETQVDDETSRIYSLIAGSVDSNELAVNSEGSLTFEAGRALHKASVRVGRSGLTFDGINNIQCSPVSMENTFNGAVNNNGASFSLTTKAIGEEGRGELNMEGEVSSSEASFKGDLKGHAYDTSTKNNMKIILNRRALTFTGETRGTMGQLTTESSHSLTVTLWTLSLRSKTDNFICKDVYYKQKTNVDLKPFIMSFDLTNDLRFYDLSLNNEGHMKLEPIGIDVSGDLSGAFKEEHTLKHTYELSYRDFAGSVKYNTSGNIMDAQLSHNCKFQFAGLSSKTRCEAQLKSEALRFEGEVSTKVLPFTLIIDASMQNDGEIDLHGKHKWEMFNMLLFNAAPLTLGWSNDWSMESSHMLPNTKVSTNLGNKFDGSMTLNEQSLNWKGKTKVNKHTFNQDFKAYNDPKKAGIEFSGVFQIDALSRHKSLQPENKEFSVSGFLKYDKNINCHVIDIPFIESFPAAFDQLKNIFVRALESLQSSIRKLDFKQLIDDFRVNLDELPVQIKGFMRQIDLENKVFKVKEKLDYLINEFAITMDDLELTVNNFRNKLEKNIMDVVTKVQNIISMLEEFIKAGHLNDKITDVFSHVGKKLQDFEDKYKIKLSLVKVLDVIEDVIRQIDVQKLRENSASFLQELDSKFGILETIKKKLSELKTFLEDFDSTIFLEKVKMYIFSFDWASFVEQLSYQIPASGIEKVMESMNDVIVNWIDEYEIPNKLNAVYSYFKDLLVKYELDDIFKDLMDQALILVKDLKIEETALSVSEALKSIKYEVVYDKIMEFLHMVTSQIKDIDFRKSIHDFNKNLSSIFESVKGFNYNMFINEVNEKLIELTNYLNEEIKKYELVNKVEALRQFFRELQNSVYTYLNELRNTKVAEALHRLKDVIDTAFYNDVKLKAQDILEDMRQRILDMDIRDEIQIYLQRAGESYRNMISFFSAQLEGFLHWIIQKADDNELLKRMKQSVDVVLDQLKKAEIDFPTFTFPFTDLMIPGFTINLNKLQEISIPAKISIPEFTILGSYTIPAFTVDFKQLKIKIVAIIDDIRGFEIQTPDPKDIFGDLRVLYLFDMPDLTFPEVVVTEIKFPTISIPKLDCSTFNFRQLAIPDGMLPEIPSEICLPLFGKLSGEFKMALPQYVLVNTLTVENSTSTSSNPTFTARFSSDAKSDIEALKHSLEATFQLMAPRMKELQFTESMKATHMSFSLDHEGSLTLLGSTSDASAKSTTIISSQVYSGGLTSTVNLKLNSVIVTMETVYNHNLNIPFLKASSQISLTQNAEARIESGAVGLTGETRGNLKWSIQDFSDEGTHKSNVALNIDFKSAKLSFTEETDGNNFKSKKTLMAECAILSHVTLEGRCETETPFVKRSVLILNGEVHLGDLKASLTASHDAELTGELTGTMSNSLGFTAVPFEMGFDVKNKIISKITFPLKLTGKVDLQHDYGVVLNSEKQRACWYALTKFNQYKYSHNLTIENNNQEIFFLSSAEGEANLDFLTVPISIPEMIIPYLKIQTPGVKDLSLWENAGLKFVLFDPQQYFVLDLTLQYHKNPELHSFELHLEPIYNIFSENAEIIQTQFENWRDKVVMLLKESYNDAKAQYTKHKIDTSGLPPRIFRVPGYKIPVLNIQVSSFSAEMPAFSYFVPKEVSTPRFRVPALGFSVPSYTLVLPSLRFPVIYFPESLSNIKLPAFTLPEVQDKIVIPAMGNITCDFLFKSPVITFSANARLHKESNIVAHFNALSTSVFDFLNGKLDGTTSMTRTRGLKLASSVSLEHTNIQANHEYSVSLSKRSLEASTASTAKINFPFVQMEISQELSCNSRTKPNVSSKKSLNYMFNIPQIGSLGKGNFDMTWEVEALSTYVSLATSTKGKSDITILETFSFIGELENMESFYANINGVRTTAQNVLHLKMDKQERQKRSTGNNLLSFDLDNNMGLEVSLQRVYASAEYVCDNTVQLSFFDTSGKHSAKAELFVVPLTSLKTTLDVKSNQRSSLGDVRLSQDADLDITSEKQSFTWSGMELLETVVHASDLTIFNDESETGLNFAGLVKGHTVFLKSIRLPVYQRTLWDILKFDEVTSVNELQFLNMSCSVLYSKAKTGYEYQIPYKLFENGVLFSIPEISFSVPSWIKEIPHSIRNIDMRLENIDVPDRLTLPFELPVPTFGVPFTNLQLGPLTIDPKNFKIPKHFSTEAFDIMLPGLPVISFPSYDINTEYLQGKMSYLLLKIPRYEITVSSFPLPKSVTVGEYTISLDDVTKKISNFQLPTIIIPEQKLEIPEIILHLPSSVFIPTFGALSASLNVSSPIYKVWSSASLEKQDSNLVTSLSSVCTSTVGLLEYDLTARTDARFNDGMINLNDMGKFTHSDVNINWQHVFARPLRLKRQTSRGDSATQEPRHTINIDITSRTFADMVFRFASRKDSITASVSSPAAGYLGLHLQRRSPSQLQGKLMSRYLSSTEKDTNVLTAKASLRNSNKLVLQTSWNLDFFSDMIEGFKNRIPAINNALLKFLNKYHSSHFGFDLNRGALKLKNSLSHLIDRTYQEFPISFSSLQSSVQNFADSCVKACRRVSDLLLATNVKDLKKQLVLEVPMAFEHVQNRFEILMEPIVELLKHKMFLLPGSEHKLSILEILQEAVQWLLSFTENMSEYIRRARFTLPGTDYLVNGDEIMNNLNSEFNAIHYNSQSYLKQRLQELNGTWNDCFQKAEYLLTELTEKQLAVCWEVEKLHYKIIKSSEWQRDEAQKLSAEYKDGAKLKLQEAYSALTVDRVNSAMKELLGAFQANVSQTLHEGVDLVRKISQSSAPYVRVIKEKMDVEIPLPFFWKSFSEWPTPRRQ